MIKVRRYRIPIIPGDTIYCVDIRNDVKSGKWGYQANKRHIRCICARIYPGGYAEITIETEELRGLICYKYGFGAFRTKRAAEKYIRTLPEVTEEVIKNPINTEGKRRKL